MRKDFIKICLEKNLWRFDEEQLLASVNERKLHLFNMELEMAKITQFGDDQSKHLKGINPYLLLL
jgi:hypothetical protein